MTSHDPYSRFRLAWELEHHRAGRELPWKQPSRLAYGRVAAALQSSQGWQYQSLDVLRARGQANRLRPMRMRCVLTSAWAFLGLGGKLRSFDLSATGCNQRARRFRKRTAVRSCLLTLSLACVVRCFFLDSRSWPNAYGDRLLWVSDLASTRFCHQVATFTSCRIAALQYWRGGCSGSWELSGINQMQSAARQFSVRQKHGITLRWGRGRQPFWESGWRRHRWIPPRSCKMATWFNQAAFASTRPCRHVLASSRAIAGATLALGVGPLGIRKSVFPVHSKGSTLAVSAHRIVPRGEVPSELGSPVYRPESHKRLFRPR